MDHRTAKDLASQALEGTLGAEEERDLALHLVACSDCKGFHDGLKGLRSVLRRLVPGDVPGSVISDSVSRAAPVLQGQADPGPVGRPATATPSPPPPVIQDAPLPDMPPDQMGSDDTDLDATGPMPPPADDEPVEATTPFEQLIDIDTREVAVQPLPDPVPISTSTKLPQADPVRIGEDKPRPEPSPEGAQVLWEDEGPPERRSLGPAALLMILAATVGLGVLAFAILTRQPQEEEATGRSLPEASVIQRGVATAFEELDSLEAEFRIQRLSVYPLRGTEQDDEVRFSFSMATETGRVAYEAPDRLRVERALEVPDATAPERSTVVRTTDALRTLLVEPAGRSVEIVEQHPLGPVAGTLLPRLGILDPAIGAPAKLLSEARDVEVVEEVTVGGSRGYLVRFGVQPDEFTRADRIEMVVDAETYFPIQVARSIAKSDGNVLGPRELLNSEAIDTAFGERERLTVERVELSLVEINAAVLPAEFELEIPEDVEPEEITGGFETVAPEALGDLDWLLSPADMPSGYREQTTVASTGRQTAWGPQNRFPAPSAIVQTQYFDGRTTVVIEQREQARGPFELPTSPIGETTMPLTERPVTAGNNEFTFAVSPEVPPHLYGWIDDVFVVISGFAPEEDLVAFAAALEGQEASPTPDGSPTGSPRPTATP